MIKTALFSIFIFWVNIMFSQDINLFYFNSQKEKISLEQNSLYDIESKPHLFFTDCRNCQDGIFLIEIYRFIDKEKHFYKSFTFFDSEITEGISINGMMDEVSSRFITTNGFSIEICFINKKDYLNIKNKNDCLAYRNYNFYYGD